MTDRQGLCPREVSDSPTAPAALEAHPKHSPLLDPPRRPASAASPEPTTSEGEADACLDALPSALGATQAPGDAVAEAAAQMPGVVAATHAAVVAGISTRVVVASAVPAAVVPHCGRGRAVPTECRCHSAGCGACGRQLWDLARAFADGDTDEALAGAPLVAGRRAAPLDDRSPAAVAARFMPPTALGFRGPPDAAGAATETGAAAAAATLRAVVAAAPYCARAELPLAAVPLLAQFGLPLPSLFALRLRPNLDGEGPAAPLRASPARPDSKSLKVLCRAAPGLAVVCFADNAAASDASLAAIARGCPALAALALGNGAHVGLKGFQCLGRHAERLELLDCSWCGSLTDDCLTTLANRAPLLRALRLDACPALTDAGPAGLAVAAPALEALSLHSSYHVTDSLLFAVGRVVGPRLLSIDLGDCPEIGDNGLRSLALGCPRLAAVCLSCCEQVTDDGVSVLFERCPGLRHLDVSHCDLVSGFGVSAAVEQHAAHTDGRAESLPAPPRAFFPGVAQQVATHHALHTARVDRYVAHYGSLDPVPLWTRAVAGGGPTLVSPLAGGAAGGAVTLVVIPPAAGLSSLRLCCVPGVDLEVLAAAAAPRTLQSLHCSGQSAVTDAAVASLAPMWGASMLELRLGECPLGDDALRAIARSCPNLEVLSVRDCPKVTDAGVAAIAAGCRALREVDLSGCPALTDAALSVLAGPALEQVALSYCRAVTDLALTAHLRRAPRLRSLTVCGCRGVTSAAATALVADPLLLPCLRFLNAVDAACADVDVVALRSARPRLTVLHSTRGQSVGDEAGAYGYSFE